MSRSYPPAPQIRLALITVRPVITDKQSVKVFAAAFRWGVTANDELLLLGQFDFNSGAAASTRLVQRIWSFCDQAFELELLCYSEKLFLCTS